jgi:hypothetical protein
MAKPNTLGLDIGIAAGLFVALLLVYGLDALTSPRERTYENQPQLTFKVIRAGAGEGKPAVPAKPLRLAVSPVQFDDIGYLLRKLGPGYENFTQLTPADLQSANRLQDHDVVFLTCASMTMRDFGLEMALKQFVEGGGTLYVSDLRFGALQGAFPEFVDQFAVKPGREVHLVKPLMFELVFR